MKEIILFELLENQKVLNSWSLDLMLQKVVLDVVYFLPVEASG